MNSDPRCLYPEFIAWSGSEVVDVLQNNGSSDRSMARGADRSFLPCSISSDHQLHQHHFDHEQPHLGSDVTHQWRDIPAHNTNHDDWCHRPQLARRRKRSWNSEASVLRRSCLLSPKSKIYSLGRTASLNGGEGGWAEEDVVRSPSPIVTASVGRDVQQGPYQTSNKARERRKCIVYRSFQSPTPYQEGWDWQKKALERRVACPEDDSLPDVMLITQHIEVYTLGTGSTLANLNFSPDEAPFDVVRTERGGEVTYHGPGQIVMYPVLNLRHHRRDVHWYLRGLEETVIKTLEKLGLRPERVEGLTGVWLEGHKVAAVGVRIKRWITMHGLSLNVHPDLDHFKHIVPCGIGDRPVGSLEQLCPEEEDMSIDRVAALLLDAFEEVFDVDVVPAEE